MDVLFDMRAISLLQRCGSIGVGMCLALVGMSHPICIPKGLHLGQEGVFLFRRQRRLLPDVRFVVGGFSEPTWRISDLPTLTSRNAPGIRRSGTFTIVRNAGCFSQTIEAAYGARATTLLFKLYFAPWAPGTLESRSDTVMSH